MTSSISREGSLHNIPTEEAASATHQAYRSRRPTIQQPDQRLKRASLESSDKEKPASIPEIGKSDTLNEFECRAPELPAGLDGPPASIPEIGKSDTLNEFECRAPELPAGLDGPTITVRAVIAGMIASVIGSTIAQMFLFKPSRFTIDPLFVQILCLLLCRLCQSIPGPRWWNPGPVSTKESVFSSIMANSAAVGSWAVEVVGAQRLVFNKEMPASITFLMLLSSQLVGFSMAGLLSPWLVYPSKISWPSVLPGVAMFHSFSDETRDTKSQISMFKKVLAAISLYEIIPTYIAPALQAISPWCLVLPQVSAVTNLFGGSLPTEGLGLLAISADWTVVGQHAPLYVPLASQVTSWVGYLCGVFLLSAAYRYNWFGGKDLPFIAYGPFDKNGKPYKLAQVVSNDGTANMDVVSRLGVPSFTTTYIMFKTLSCIAISCSITSATYFCVRNLKWDQESKRFRSGEEEACPHRAITKNLVDLPLYAYVIILALSIGMALIASQVGHSGLSIIGLLTCLLLAFVLCIATAYFEGTVGLALRTDQVARMIGGALFPGNAFRNLWFMVYGTSSVAQANSMLKDMKLGQYMHLPPIAVVIAQLTGSLIGAVVNYEIMIMVMRTQHDVLLLPAGNGVFSGMTFTVVASEATSWGLFSRELYYPGKRYFIVPLGLILGFLVPIPFIILGKRWPNSSFKDFNPALMASSMGTCIWGITSGRTTSAVVGFTSQYVMRKYHTDWYRKYNYIICAALDGGSQIAVVVLGLLLQGGAGLNIKFPTYPLNPEGPRDYCVMKSG